MTSVVFLDIDGVLNSHDWFARNRKDENLLDHLDPDACALVHRLCAETGSDLVISSTWRLLYKRTRLLDVFKARGLKARIVGGTPAIPTSKGRGEEIHRWLDTAPGRYDIRGMVIIDDDSDMLHLDRWLVRTPFATGLTDEHVERAKEVLTWPMPLILGAA